MIRNGVPYIVSLANRELMDTVCRGLDKLDFKYFVMYIIFNNGKRFVLSNIYNMLIPYYTEEFYKEDFCFRPDIIFSRDHYLCNKVQSVSEKFKLILEQRFNVHRVYYIIRHYTECVFVFGAIKDKRITDYKEIYKKTINGFEDFCVDFVNEFLDIIKEYNQDYMQSFIFTNAQLRKAVIKKGYSDCNHITKREKQCLWWTSKGKSTKEVARILNISPATVETHNKNIREKLNCSTMIEAVVESIHRGIIGKVNPVIEYQDDLSHRKVEIIKNMKQAHLKIQETNIMLLNSVKF